MEIFYNKKKVFAAIQPSGVMTIGNYYGSVKNWVRLQRKFDCNFAVADFHAITAKQNHEELRNNIMNTFACLIACGISTQKANLFLQSSVSAHSELAWIINCHTEFYEFFNLEQFSTISINYNSSLINAGLFTYPSLMAADILLYNTDFVPIGADQKQHLELIRTIAARFNSSYGDVFTIPEPFIPKVGAKIMSLQNPLKKMSKSDENEDSKISIFDNEESIIHKFSKAVTDSDNKVFRAENKEGINNLMSIYSCATGKTDQEIETEFSGKGYVNFKKAVANAVFEELKPIQEKFSNLINDEHYIKKCYKEGALKASNIAQKTLKLVKKKVGFLP